MGFFNANYLHERRVQWKDSIAKIQYCVEGEWYDAVINSAVVKESKIIYSVVIPALPETSHIISGIRLLGTDGKEAAMQELSIQRSLGQSLAVTLNIPIQEV